jgi:hypothetical protein
MYHHHDYGVSFPVVLVGISKKKAGERGRDIPSSQCGTSLPVVGGD